MQNNDKTMSYIDISRSELTLELETVVHHHPSADWKWDHKASRQETHGSPILVWLVTGGKSRIQSSFGNHLLQCGDFLVMPFSGFEYHGRQDSKNPMEVIWLIFQVLNRDGQVLDIKGIEGIPFHLSLTDLPFAQHLANCILLSEGSMKGHWLRVLLAEVRRQAQTERESDAEKRIRHICEKIQKSPGHYRSLNDLIGECHYSKDHLIRLFRRHRGITPGEFIIRTRIDNARGLLTIPSLSVKQVSAQLGYPDSCSFSKQFKERVGVSPKTFRINVR